VTGDLFSDAPRATARLSDDGVYRYDLTRTWGNLDGPATFIMLNPSTADAAADDPTIRRCIGFARSWGCDGLRVVNLYALRSTDPRSLWTHPDPVGPDNDTAIADAASAAAYDDLPLVAAWGTHARPDRVERVLALPYVRDRLQCLGVTNAGAPRHPLYLPASQPLLPWPITLGRPIS
jgi:hypothetical protein